MPTPIEGSTADIPVKKDKKKAKTESPMPDIPPMDAFDAPPPDMDMSVTMETMPSMENGTPTDGGDKKKKKKKKTVE